MEIRLIVALLKKHIILLSSIILVTTIGSIGYSLRTPISYEVAVSLISTYESSNTNDYQFDGFYATQASERFASQVIVGVLKSSAAAKEIYQNAGVPLKTTSVKALNQLFQPNKRTERVVDVYFNARNQEESEKLAKALGELMDLHAQIASKSSQDGTFFVNTSDPVILKSTSKLWLWSALGFVGGLIIATFVVLFLSYFEEDFKNKIA